MQISFNVIRITSGLIVVKNKSELSLALSILKDSTSVAEQKYK